MTPSAGTDTSYIDVAYLAIVDDWSEIKAVVGNDSAEVEFAPQWSNATKDATRKADGSCVDHILYTEETGAVFGDGHRGGLTLGPVVGVHKIDVRALVHIAEDGVAFFKVQGIPPDVRNLQPCGNLIGNRADGPLNEAEAAMTAVLIALLKKELHPKANAENRLALTGGGEDKLGHSAFTQKSRGIPEGTDPGQDDALTGKEGVGTVTLTLGSFSFDVTFTVNP